MKKFLFSLLAIFFAFCFTSCNDQAADSTESSIEEICNIPITSVEDFSLSDGKYEMLIEGGNTSPQRNLKQKNIVTIKTIDSERFAEIHLCYYYEKTEFLNLENYKTRKDYLLTNMEEGLKYDFNDELLTITINNTEDYQLQQYSQKYEDFLDQYNISYSIKYQQNDNYYAKMNNDKTIFSFSIAIGETDPTIIITTLTKQD